MFIDDKGDTAVPCFLQYTRSFSAVKSEDFADFKTLTLKISAKMLLQVYFTLSLMCTQSFMAVSVVVFKL